MSVYNKGVEDNQKLRTTDVYWNEEKNKFVPIPIDVAALSEAERIVLNKQQEILDLIGGLPAIVKSIEIVEKIYESDLFRGGTVGLWLPDKRRILIKRTQLSDISKFAGTLLHECAHALSGHDDVSRDFEKMLTEFLGIIAKKAIM